MYKEIKNCRLCNGNDLTDVFSLGNQKLTGFFPKTKNEKIAEGPVDLCLCNKCGLVQLRQTYDLAQMYGDNYGYKSSLNNSMVRHLSNKHNKLNQLINLEEGDVVVDIGSNDGTFLNFYPENLIRIGVDPSAKKFESFYKKNISVILDFFDKNSTKKILLNHKKAKLITSIAMFYDLPKPNDFVKDISDLLDDNGIWHFEQSYLPLMLDTNSYDTLCHEHLEFYSLRVINKMLIDNGLKLLNIELNDINGGSIAITACKNNSKLNPDEKIINAFLNDENNMNLGSILTYQKFAENAKKQKSDLINLLNKLNSKGKTVYGYGASTKGNVTLQYCGLTSKEIPLIVEVNSDKFGSFTPGSNIPIISESEIEKAPDYYLLLPWHFKDFVIDKESEFLKNGGKFIIPFPEVHIV